MSAPTPWARAVAQLPTDERRIAAVLRFVGRLEFVPGRLVRQSVFPDLPERTAALHLQRLHAQRLLWQCPIPPSRIPTGMHGTAGKPPPQPPLLYGLTEKGRGWLAERGVDDTATRATFIVRDWKAPEVKAPQLAHDLMVVQWCVSALAAAGRSRWLVDARCQVEYVSLVDERGQAVQRFDALLVLTIDPSRDRIARPAWEIPWSEGLTPPPGARVLRVALEADRGTEKLAILLGKAAMYRNLALMGHYGATLGGEVVPLVICPPGRRAAQIGREWFDAWPGGAGLISSTTAAYDKTLGALGGRYFTMTEQPAREVSLLAELGIDRASWEASLV